MTAAKSTQPAHSTASESARRRRGVCPPDVFGMSVIRISNLRFEISARLLCRRESPGVRVGQGPAAVGDVALRALEGGVSLFLIRLDVERAALVRRGRDVAG